MNLKHTWIIATLLVATTFTGCSSTPDPKKYTPNPITPNPKFTMSAPQSYDIALAQLVQQRFDGATTNLDITTQQDPTSVFGYQAQVLKAMIQYSRFDSNNDLLRHVRDMITSPDKKDDQARKDLEESIKRSEEYLAEMLPKWKRLEALGNKRAQDLTAAEQVEMEEYADTKERVELYQRSLEQERQELAALPAKTDGKKQEYAKMEAFLLKDNQRYFDELTPTVQYLLDRYPKDIPLSFFEVAYAPQKSFETTYKRGPESITLIPDRLKAIAEGTDKDFKTIEPMQTSLFQMYFNGNVKQLNELDDEAFYAQAFYTLSYAYKDKDPAMYRKLLEKVLEVTEKYSTEEVRYTSSVAMEAFDIRNYALDDYQKLK